MQLQLNQQAYSHRLGKIVCVGRNYAAHAAELNNPVPSSPLLFIKPASSAIHLTGDWGIPLHRGSVHHELEIALLIGKRLSHASTEQVEDSIVGVGLALDLTLRDLQARLKDKGHPWELAKSFDGACPLSEFIVKPKSVAWQDVGLRLYKNTQLKQQGQAKEMLFQIAPLISYMSEHFSLDAGDVILTGTPAGVGPLSVGDVLQSQLLFNDTVVLDLRSKVQ